MASEIKYDVVGTSELDKTHTVTWTVTSTTDMPEEVFVHKFSTEKFDHVANAGDLIWPTAKDPQKAFYRLSAASANYPDLDKAEADKVVVAAAIEALVDLYTAGLATFLTPESVTYP